MKKIVLFTALALCFVNAFAQKSVDSTDYDAFLVNNGWEAINTDAARLELTKEGLIVEQKKPEGSHTFFKKIDIDYSKDYSFEISIEQLPGGNTEYGHGFVWGMKDWDDYNRIQITPSGYFQITSTVNKTTTDLVAWKKDPGVRATGENILYVEKKKDEVKFFLNGKEIFSTPTSNIKVTGKYFGILVYRQKQLKIKYLKTKGTYRKLNLVPNAIKGYKHENLGANVNTVYEDKCPLIAPDGKTIYFCNDREDGNKDDAWFAKLKPDGTWDKAQRLSSPVNNVSSNAVQSVSADNNILYLLHKYKDDGTFKSAGMSYATRSSSGWTMPKDIVIDNYFNEHKYAFHSFSHDNKYMLSALQTKDTYGDADVYVSFKKGNGSYSEPMNIGNIINTTGSETTPFLASDNKTMYFSSNGHPGYGNNDIFVTHRLDDTWKNWSEPQNLGPEINTDGWDAYFSIPASGEEAYLVTNKNTLGKADIVKVKLTEQARPKPVVLVSGRVLNKKTGEPLSAVIKYFDLQTNEDAGEATSNPSTGEYNIILQAGKNYGFRADKENFYAVNDMLDVTSLSEYKEIRKDLFLVPIEVGQSIRLNNVFFDFNKADLKPESYGELDRLVDFLRSNSKTEIEIGGHTDNVGADDYNLKLSQQRTESVVNYLISKGINKSRLQAKGYGKSKPVATNDTEDGKSINRRVEFTITKQ